METIELLSKGELEAAAKKLKNGKAPEIDVIPAEVDKAMVEATGNMVLRVMNGLYEIADCSEVTL